MLEQKKKSNKNSKTNNYSLKSQKLSAGNQDAQFCDALAVDDCQLKRNAQGENQLELQQSLSELLSNDNHSKQDEQN